MSHLSLQYKKLNNKSLKGYFLLNERNEHIKYIAKRLIMQEYNYIIPLEYIDEQIRLDCIIKNIEPIINDKTRIKYVTNLLLKECKIGTSLLISQMCI